jgi:putative transposase
VFRPPATPHFGGHIERLIGTVMGAVHLLPGTTYSNTQERGNYASEDAATLSMPELESWLAIQICEGYHQTPHSALGMTPTMAWKLAVHHGMEVVMPSDSRRLLLSFLPVVRRTLQRSGLYVNNIRYCSDVLPPIAPVGEEVFLRVDPRNLSKVYVRARDGAYVDVPYADIRYPPISLWEQRAAAKGLREERVTRVRQEALFKKNEAQRLILAQAAAKTKDARRHVERLRRAGSVPMGAGSTEPASVNYDIDAPPFAVETWESES